MTETETLANINKIQAEIDAISEQTKKKIVLIEKNYAKQLQSEYEKRDAMIAKSGVPMFWGTVIERGLIDMFDSLDQQVIGYIEEFTASSEFTEDAVIKKITFKFKENPFFTNKELSRTVSMSTKDSDSDFNITPAIIDWKSPQSDKKPEKSENNKKRKEQSNIKENSFILKLLANAEEDVEWFEELMRMYQDPFSILIDDDEEEEGGFDFGEDSGEDEDEDEEEVEEVAPKKSAAPKQQQQKKKK
ncbi:nucleosome assembly protein family protein [Heterostelium album PN500]|uniref:Nucleosome assembly protein family protein n=1 Tax=Heterostelium pallidum (strain ATCC 26659 / Pp 5 / PN500) TaxID=670386 RepID=D3B5K9_HETP5|nr:nucleosome assembly protein family protein [Heterostelium album PN500]EFA83157.1 nucleosome assembly protein family protein [Heterostelium album PN500]|eukprot:XP_020435274.1 nucleosome assembly protein family protein [Heterostelium album PN500]